MVFSSYKAALLISSSLLARGYCASSYDAIIVGAGPAGIIVADRLSSANLSVLLLEKGGPSYSITGGASKPDWLSNTSLSRVDVPGLYSSIFSGNGGDLLCSDASAFQACTIGGNSAINAGLYFTAPSWDYATAGWGPAEFAAPVQRLLARIPGTSTPSADGERYVQSTYAATAAWLQAAGYAEVDLNAEPERKTKAYGHTVYDYHDAQRGGPVASYLQTALARPNFTLRSGVNVANITRTAGTATGVLTSAGESIALAAGGIVVAAGGPLFTPALLYKSGIGPAGVLDQLAIPAGARIANENVGQNLYDNPNTFLEFTSAAVDAYNYAYDGTDADKQAYVANRTGPYTTAGQSMAFWDRVGDVYLQGTVGPAGYADYTGPHDWTINVYGTSGIQSRGSVVLDANGHPGPDGNVYYSNDADADAIAQFLYGLLQSLPESISSRNLPANSTVAQIRSYITTWSAYAVGQVNHWGGSCKLAASLADGGCADLNAKVFGTENVFVVDSSIINGVLTANPQFGVMAYAETASDKILALRV